MKRSWKKQISHWEKLNFEWVQIAMVSKFYFSQWKIYSSEIIFIKKYLKSKEIKYLIH